MDKSTITKWLSWAWTQAAAILAGLAAIVAAFWKALPQEVQKAVAYMAAGAVVLLVLLFAFGLVGCPSNLDIPSPAPAPDVSPAPEPKPVPEPDHKRRRIIREGVEYWEPTDAEPFDPGADKFWKDHPGLDERIEKETK